MERKKASDFPQGLLRLFDRYVHGDISRREFLDGAQSFAVGGVTAAALFEMLRPNYAWAIQVQKDDSRIKAETVTVPSPRATEASRAIWCVRRTRPESCPACLSCTRTAVSIRTSRTSPGGSPSPISSRSRPDSLTSLGGYPGDDEKGGTAFRPARPRQDDRGFPGRANVAEVAPGL